MSFNTANGPPSFVPQGANPFPPPPVPYYGDPMYASVNPAAARGDDPLAAAALLIANFINKTLIAHPCTVLKHQCQVHQKARRLHLTPVTMVPVVIHMVSKDGIQTLWKGSLGCAVLSGMSYVVEVIIGDVFGLPRTIVPNGSREKFWKHVTLKAWTYFTMTPFMISSFIETARSGSGVGIADTNIMDIVFRGIDRLRFDLFGGKDTGKKFPVFYLAVPTTTYYIAHYLISKWAFNTIYGMARRYVLKKPPQDRTRFHSILPELFAGMTSSLAANLICYPFETVLHRLYIQGTRTLIDNLDNGISAISITAKYSGFFDCFSSIIKNEGFLSLYAGVGALALQYCLQFCVFRFIRSMFEYATSPVQLQVCVDHQVRSGPNSNIGHPSAQFAAVGTPTTSTSGSPKKLPFPTFAQTSANMDITSPLGVLHNNFSETSNVMGGSSSPPTYHHSPVRTNDMLLKESSLNER